MKSRLFEFFRFDILEANLKNGDQLSSQNFARFLAAYYLNFPLYVGFEVTDEVPSLLFWKESEYSQNPELSISRLDVANEVPPEYTAKFALQLLLDVCGVIEATFFTDHFNDAQTALQVRLVTDYILDVKLFASYCRESLVAELLDRADTLAFVQPSEVLSAAAPAIEALVQIDAVFGLTCHITVEHLALQLAEEILFRLPSTVKIDEVKLPRPAIYATSTESAVDNCEIVAWNKMHYFLHLFLTSLKLTNRFASFVQFVVGALLKYNPNYTDLNMGISPTQMFGNVDFCANESEFFRVLLIILQVNARDLFTLSKITPECEGRSNNSTYFYLVNSERIDPEVIFKTWMGVAELEEIQQIVEFLTYIKNDCSNEERYLPPFTEKNRKTWQNHFFADKKFNSTADDVPVVYDVFSKFPIDINTSKKLDFICNNWKRFVKSESELMSGFLGLAPDDFVEIAELPKAESTFCVEESPLQQFMKNMLLESNEETCPVDQQPTLTANDFVAPSQQKRRTKPMRGDEIFDVKEIRHRVRQEADFMNAVMSERKAAIGIQMRLRASEMAIQTEMPDRAPHISMTQSQSNVDIVSESAHLTHRIRERLDDDLRQLEDGLREIQQVIRETERHEEREERDISFRSASSTVVSIPLGVLHSTNRTAKQLPASVFRLDLSQLSPAPSVTGHVYIRNDDEILDSQDSAPLSTIEMPFEASSIQATISDKSEFSKTIATSVEDLEKPSWLHLIPWQQTNPSSVRVLEMPKEQPLTRISTTARRSFSPVHTHGKHHYDSGFIETTEERVTVVSTRRRKFEYVNGMSQNEIDTVVQLMRN